jgi:hypothetical protein
MIRDPGQPGKAIAVSRTVTAEQDDRAFPSPKPQQQLGEMAAPPTTRTICGGRPRA